MATPLLTSRANSTRPEASEPYEGPLPMVRKSLPSTHLFPEFSWTAFPTPPPSLGQPVPMVRPTCGPSYAFVCCTYGCSTAPHRGPEFAVPGWKSWPSGWAGPGTVPSLGPPSTLSPRRPVYLTPLAPTGRGIKVSLVMSSTLFSRATTRPAAPRRSGNSRRSLTRDG